MTDPLKKHIAKLKIMAESAKRRSELYSGLTNLDDKHLRRSLSALHKAPSPGKKIQKIDKIRNKKNILFSHSWLEIFI